LETRDVVVVLQAVPKSHPELTSIPLAINFAKTDEAKKLIDAGIHDTQIFTRPYVLPPGTPKERVQVLRKAFLDTLKDKEFLAEAEKSKLDVDRYRENRWKRSSPAFSSWSLASKRN
jgi:hypothetical protein